MRRKILWFPTALFVAGCELGDPSATSLPYIVSVQSGASATDTIDLESWEENGGVTALPGVVGPRASIRVTFSEIMSLPITVPGPPMVWLATEENISWIDHADGGVERPVTVLTGVIPGGLEPDTAYALTFDGLADEPVRDERGHALTIRFGGTRESSARARREPRTDVRALTTAPVRIERVDDGSVRGVFTERVAAVRVSVGSSADTMPPSPGIPAPFADSVSITAGGVPVRSFHLEEAGTTCGDVVFAEGTDANGVSLGWDAMPNWDCFHD